MTTLKANTAQKITFVLQDASGDEVTGLGNGFSLSISKNGGAFTAGTGTKAEIGSGWYSYELTAGETDTPGPLGIKVTGASVDQQNLLYQVSESGWETPAGPNILSVEEAANVLRCDEEDPNMLMLLPQIDAYIVQATGRAWEEDDPIREEAKAAARMLLVRWHEDPGGMAAGETLGPGIRACLTQLEALALQLTTEGIPDEDLAITARFPRDGADEIYISAKPVLVFNHEMDEDAEDCISLVDASGNTISTTGALDASGKIITVTPATDLKHAASYTLVIEAAPDVYGQTISEEIRFRTE